MDTNTHRVRTKVRCGGGHEHELCVVVSRGVPPELRCADEQPAGWSFGGGGCNLPEDLADQVERELRDDFQECKRRGYVLIAA
jgi:ADP-ribose pyrophosphatase YjhB (NUDIX family)